MRIDKILGVVVALGLGACSHHSQNRLNILSTTGQGEPVDVLTNERLDNSAFAGIVDATIDNIIATAPVRNGKKQVLVYIHGGLLPNRRTLSKADNLKDSIEREGYYPIFVVWQSNLTRTYFEHLFLIRQGRRSHFIGPITSPFFLVGDLAIGLIHAPGTYFQQIKTGLSTMGRKVFSHQTTARKREDALMSSPLDSLTVLKGGDRRGKWNRFGRFMLYLVTLVPKFVTMPIVDGLGEPAFENMYRRTETMFRSPAEARDSFNDYAVSPDSLKNYGGGTGAIARFFVELEKVAAARGDIEVTLVGHSMGSIVANRILRYHPALPVRRIVYMAAACTIQDFRDTVVPYMQRNRSTRFYNLCLHPMAESREIQWKFLDLPPRGSLLEWIDNFLSSPRTPADYTLGKWDNIMLASHLIPVDVRSRVVLRSYGVSTGDDPQRHGSFDEYPFWEAKFWGEE